MVIQYYRYTPGKFDYTWTYLVDSKDIGGRGCVTECEWMVPGTCNPDNHKEIKQ